jgi:flagellar basal-body rod modification protein FlgD
MMIASIDSLINTSATKTTTSTKANDSLDKEDFLNLFVTQLKNQDPLDPQDNTEACTQLAQYSELEAMLDVKQNIADLKTTVTDIIPELNASVQYNTGLSLIGCTVRIEQDAVTWYGDTSEPLSLSVNAGKGDAVSVSILDSDGNTVKTLDGTADENGVATISWDGTDDNGDVASVGSYSVQVEGSESDASLYAFIEGTVEGASTKDNKSTVRVNGQLYPVSKLIDVGI